MTSKGKSLFFALVATFWFDAPFAHAYQSVSMGMHYLQGDYDDEVKTRMWYLPLSYKIRGDRWMGQITVPWLRLSGPGGIVGEGGTIVFSGPNWSSVKASGVGDSLIKVGYGLLQDYQSMLLIDVIGKWKIPTADETEGLGSGQDDFSLQIDIAKQWREYAFFSSLGYKQRGDGSIRRKVVFAGVTEILRQKISLADGWYSSVGFSQRLSPSWRMGLLFDYRQPSNKNNDDVHEALLYGQWRIDKRRRVSSYIGKGFTHNSSDANAGFQFSYRF